MNHCFNIQKRLIYESTSVIGSHLGIIVYKYIVVVNVSGMKCEQLLNTVYVYSYNTPTFTVVMVTKPHCSD